MSAVDDAKKYLSLRPPMENKTIFALHPDVLVGGLLDEIERLREALKEIADAKISGVIGDGYNVRDWLIKHHVMLVNKARAALKEGE